MADTPSAPAQFGVPWMLVALLVGVTGGGVGGGFIRPSPAAAAPVPPVPPVPSTPSELTAKRLDELEDGLDELEDEVGRLADAQRENHMMMRDVSRSVGWIVLQTQKNTVALGAIAAAQDIEVDLFVAALPQVDPK